MTNITDMLRDADPVRHERDAHLAEHDRLRRTVIAALPDPVAANVPRPVRRRAAIAVAAMLALAIAGAVTRSWLGSTATLQAAVRFEVRLAQTEPAPGLQQVRVAGSKEVIYLHPETVVTNDDIEDAHIVGHDDSQRFDVAVTFNAAGAAKMTAATEAHMGQPMAVLIDGEAVMAPVIRATIAGKALITGNFTRAEAERIVTGITRR